MADTQDPLPAGRPRRPRVEGMTVAQDLLLVALDPSTHKVRLSSMTSDATLGGAVLLDLVATGHLAITRQGRKARVLVADPGPVGDAVLEASFARVRQRGRQKPSSAVGRLGKGVRAAELARLSDSGAIAPTGQRLLGIRLERHEVVDAARRDDLVARTRAVLLQDQPADATTGPLVGLLLASDQLTLVVDRADRKRATSRAKVVSEGDWASEGVRQAIAQAQALLTGVIVSSAVVGGSSS